MTSAEEPGARFNDRVADARLDPVPSDWTTSPAALAVLRDRGVGAWRRWCRANRPPETREAGPTLEG